MNRMAYVYFLNEVLYFPKLFSIKVYHFTSVEIKLGTIYMQLFGVFQTCKKKKKKNFTAKRPKVTF